MGEAATAKPAKAGVVRESFDEARQRPGHPTAAKATAG